MIRLLATVTVLMMGNYLKAQEAFVLKHERIGDYIFASGVASSSKGNFISRIKTLEIGLGNAIGNIEAIYPIIPPEYLYLLDNYDLKEKGVELKKYNASFLTRKDFIRGFNIVSDDTIFIDNRIYNVIDYKIDTIKHSSTISFIYSNDKLEFIYASGNFFNIGLWLSVEERLRLTERFRDNKSLSVDNRRKHNLSSNENGRALSILGSGFIIAGSGILIYSEYGDKEGSNLERAIYSGLIISGISISLYSFHKIKGKEDKTSSLGMMGYNNKYLEVKSSYAMNFQLKGIGLNFTLDF